MWEKPEIRDLRWPPLRCSVGHGIGFSVHRMSGPPTSHIPHPPSCQLYPHERHDPLNRVFNDFRFRMPHQHEPFSFVTR